MPPKGWNFVGAGTYNEAYKSDDGKFVLKIQKDSRDKTDRPARSVRLWNIINSHLPPPARLVNTGNGVGWICPFIKGEQASDKEMSEALIDIYNRTGRIVVDATAAKNFVKTDDKVVCVDIGLALQMEQREDTYFSERVPRRKSFVSLNTWKADFNDGDEDEFVKFFEGEAKTYPDTVNTVKALLFIKNNRPDIFDADFLKSKPDLVTKLASAYDKNGPQGVLQDLDDATSEEVKIGKAILSDQRAPIFDNIKESCLVELQRYIDSRGSINQKTGQFEPSLITTMFRETAVTERKVAAVRALMSEIQWATTLDGIADSLNERASSALLQSKYTKGLATSIGRCMITINKAEKNLEFQLDGKPLSTKQ